MYPFKYTEVSEREIQLYEMIKSLMRKCSSLIYLQICITQ